MLATGPTGSGKTTTLYAALQQIDTARLNVMTVEDPIEYHLERIGQTQVNPRIDLTFARALRSILRQDPDVVMIGEIRDAETAQIAIQASLTGHLVLATLHTNDAAGAVTRLIDMGIEPFLLASSLRGVLAQRLVRKVCGACALQVVPNEQEQGDLRLLGLLEQPGQDVGTAFATVARIVGCAQCGHTGFRGRTGIYELLEVTEAIRPLIHDAVPEKALRDAAAYSTLAADGARWVRDGVTTPAELLRVVRES